MTLQNVEKIKGAANKNGLKALRVKQGLMVCSHVMFAFSSTSPSSLTLCQCKMSRIGSDPFCVFLRFHCRKC